MIINKVQNHLTTLAPREKYFIFEDLIVQNYCPSLKFIEFQSLHLFFDFRSLIAWESFWKAWKKKKFVKFY